MVTLQQIEAMRSPALSGSFPRLEGMRPDGTLIVALTYTLSHQETARAQGYRSIAPDGTIAGDSVYSYSRKRFVGRLDA